jgi:predicted Zn-dependent protease
MKRAPLIALLAAVALAAAPGAAQDPLSRLAGAARGAAGASLPIGISKEREIGRGIAATVAGRWKVLNDSALIRYVTLVGQVVARQSPRWTEIPFRFAVLDTDEVNAFAAPGGYIFVTRGALQLIESESELAGVLAHEVAHVDQKHVLEQIRKFDAMNRARSEADLTGPLLDEVAGFGAGLLFMGVGRGEEMEADSLGALYAAAAGYRVDGLSTFVTRLVEDGTPSGRGGPLRELRATHPPASARLEALQRQLAAAGTDPASGRLLADRYRMYVSRRAGPGGR